MSRYRYSPMIRSIEARINSCSLVETAILRFHNHRKLTLSFFFSGPSPQTTGRTTGNSASYKSCSPTAWTQSRMQRRTSIARHTPTSSSGRLRRIPWTDSVGACFGSRSFGPVVVIADQTADALPPSFMNTADPGEARLRILVAESRRDRNACHAAVHSARPRGRAGFWGGLLCIERYWSIKGWVLGDGDDDGSLWQRLVCIGCPSTLPSSERLEGHLLRRSWA